MKGSEVCMGQAAGPLVGLEVGHGGLEDERCHANSRKNVTFFCLMWNLLHLGYVEFVALGVCTLKHSQFCYLGSNAGCAIY